MKTEFFVLVNDVECWLTIGPFWSDSAAELFFDNEVAQYVSGSYGIVSNHQIAKSDEDGAEGVWVNGDLFEVSMSDLECSVTSPAEWLTERF